MCWEKFNKAYNYVPNYLKHNYVFYFYSNIKQLSQTFGNFFIFCRKSNTKKWGYPNGQYSPG